MLEPLNFELGGESYQLLPHTGFAALDLDRKVTALMGRIVGNAGADSDDFPNRIFVALGSALSEYSPSEYRDIVESTLSRVTVTTTGKKNVSLSTSDAVAEHFAGRYADLYNLLFKVWELNRFSPFAQPRTEPGTAGT